MCDITEYINYDDTGKDLWHVPSPPQISHTCPLSIFTNSSLSSCVHCAFPLTCITAALKLKMIKVSADLNVAWIRVLLTSGLTFFIIFPLCSSFSLSSCLKTVDMASSCDLFLICLHVNTLGFVLTDNSMPSESNVLCWKLVQYAYSHHRQPLTTDPPYFKMPP